MKKGLSIFLALLLLISNVSLSHDIHYCGGKPVKTAFSFGNVDLDCGMEFLSKGDCFQRRGSEILKISPKPCCEDQHEALAIDVDFNYSKTSPSGTNLFFANQVFYSETNLSGRQNIDLKFLYTPPLPVLGLTVLFQRFII